MVTSAHDTIAPSSAAGAEKILSRLYGISGRASRLPGELDVNFRIDADSGAQFLLKIHSPDSKPEILDLQNKALAHLQRVAPHLDLPRVVPTRSGDESGIWPGDEDASHSVRLLTWLEGRLWAEMKPSVTETGPALGTFLGRLDKALATFSHPAMQREYLWDPQSIDRQLDMLDRIEPDAVYDSVRLIITRFREELAPRLASLPKQVIHNDANDHNVVLDKDSNVGLIDFNDIVYSYRASEVAVACAYVMPDHPDPIAVALPIVAAYHLENPLCEDEIELLSDLIQARIATSICMAARQIADDPHNAYLLVSQKPFRTLLASLANENRELAICRFRDACGLPANPKTPKIIRWLEQNRHRFANVCRFDLKDHSKLTVIKLGVDSGAMSPPDERFASTAEFAQHISASIRSAGAEVGVGRYLERRTVYKSEHFEITGSTEQRDVHLGIDLSLPAGEPIYAPLPGVVEALANNKDRYDFGPIVIVCHEIGDGTPFWTLYGHLSAASLDRLKVGQPIEQGGLLGWVGDYPHNGDWPPHLHFQVLTTLLDMGTGVHGVAALSQLDVWESISPDPNLVLGIPFNCCAPVHRSRQYLMNQRRRFLGKMLKVFYKEPIKIVRGEGQYLYDEKGNRWLDMINNVCHVGHCHPEVVAAGQAQMQMLNTNTRFLHDNIVAYVRRLLATFPDPLSICFLVNSGSEANDLALRLAWTYTKRKDLLVVEHSYHGHLSSLIDISHYKFAGKGGTGCPDHVWTTSCPDGYRGRFRYSEREAGRRYAAEIRRQIDTMQASGRRPAAFIAESLGGVAGQIVPPPEYLHHAYAHVRAAGGLCIADEVQVGFGRVGDAMWAFETQGVVPDIVTLGKPIGNGHPLAAVITRPEIADAFSTGMEYFNTFGGNPVSCAIGLAVLDVIRNENLIENANRVGTLIRQGLELLQQKYSLIGDVRGLGLFIGAELVHDRKTLAPATEEAAQIVASLKKRGVLLSTDGPYDNVLKIKPPMCITVDDARYFLGALDEAFAELD
ncbi:MAG: aminotransferase class III-fold pyridoxal phosphate-dependent enzyme [Acidiferrobacterales bacterium]